MGFFYAAKPRVIIPLRVIRTVSQHYVWCLSEGTPPINISLMNSSTTLASRTGVVWSKLNQGGNYSCIAANEVGTESKMFYVSLTGEIIAKVNHAVTQILVTVLWLISRIRLRESCLMPNEEKLKQTLITTSILS